MRRIINNNNNHHHHHHDNNNNNDNRSNNKSSESLWKKPSAVKSTSRRFQLAVKTSFRSSLSLIQKSSPSTDNNSKQKSITTSNNSSISSFNYNNDEYNDNNSSRSEDDFDNNKDDQEVDDEILQFLSTSNIDEAMSSLYSTVNNEYFTLKNDNDSEDKSTNRFLSSSSISVHQQQDDEIDWMIDGKEEWYETYIETNTLLQNLYSTYDRNDLIEYLDNEIIEYDKQRRRQLEQDDEYQYNNIYTNDDDDDDDDFGDFQTAPTTQIQFQPTIVIIPEINDIKQKSIVSNQEAITTEVLSDDDVTDNVLTTADDTSMPNNNTNSTSISDNNTIDVEIENEINSVNSCNENNNEELRINGTNNDMKPKFEITANMNSIIVTNQEVNEVLFGDDATENLLTAADDSIPDNTNANHQISNNPNLMTTEQENSTTFDTKLMTTTEQHENSTILDTTSLAGNQYIVDEVGLDTLDDHDDDGGGIMIYGDNLSFDGNSTATSPMSRWDTATTDTRSTVTIPSRYSDFNNRRASSILSNDTIDEEHQAMTEIVTTVDQNTKHEDKLSQEIAMVEFKYENQQNTNCEINEQAVTLVVNKAEVDDGQNNRMMLSSTKDDLTNTVECDKREELESSSNKVTGRSWSVNLPVEHCHDLNNETDLEEKKDEHCTSSELTIDQKSPQRIVPEEESFHQHVNYSNDSSRPYDQKQDDIELYDQNQDGIEPYDELADPLDQFVRLCLSEASQTRSRNSSGTTFDTPELIRLSDQILAEIAESELSDIHVIHAVTPTVISFDSATTSCNNEDFILKQPIHSTERLIVSISNQSDHLESSPVQAISVRDDEDQTPSVDSNIMKHDSAHSEIESQSSSERVKDGLESINDENQNATDGIDIETNVIKHDSAHSEIESQVPSERVKEVLESLNDKNQNATEGTNIETNIIKHDSAHSENEPSERLTNGLEAINDKNQNATEGTNIETNIIKHDSAHSESEPSERVADGLESLNDKNQNEAEGINSETRDLMPLWLILPIDDVSTPEGRFTRRRQLEFNKTQSMAIDSGSLENEPTTHSKGYGNDPKITKSLSAFAREYGLPPYFFNTTNDDTVRFLKSVPWDFVVKGTEFALSVDGSSVSTSTFKDESDEQNWDEYCTSTLCDLDETLRKVQIDLLKNIEPNSLKIQDANSCIHEFDKNLRLAFMYWERTKEALDFAIGDVKIEGSGLFDGPRTLLQLWQRRDEHQKVNDIFEKLDYVWEQEQELLERIDCFDVRHGNALDEYFNVRKLASELENTINNDNEPVSLAGLRCLDDMRTRLASLDQRFWRRLLSLSESLVVRCCRNVEVDWMEYNSLLHAVFDLQTSRLHLNVTNDFDWVQSWINNIVSAVSFELQRSFALALLEPSFSNEDHDAYDLSIAKELMQLNNEVDLDWGDFGKLRSVILSLVNIRFAVDTTNSDEQYLCYLPPVYHKLCRLQASVLNAYTLFVSWHQNQFKLANTTCMNSERNEQQEALLEEIVCKLLEQRSQVWKVCERVLCHPLHEYLRLASKRVLFKQLDTHERSVDDSAWIRDLHGLHNILRLTDKFVLLGPAFHCQEAQNTSDADTSDIYEKLVSIFRTNLRAIHANAMNTIGKRLAGESWILGEFNVNEKTEKNSRIAASLEDTLITALGMAYQQFAHPPSPQVGPTSFSGSERTLEHKICFPLDANPFDNIAWFVVERTEISAETMHGEFFEESPQVRDALSILLQERRMSPHCVTRELIGWFARLLATMDNLPLIIEDTCLVFLNLCDLYLSTVLRICAGNAKNEKIILGIDSIPCLPLDAILDSKHGSKSHDNTTTSPMFRPFRTGKQKGAGVKRLRRKSTSLTSPYLDAEINAPLMRDQDSIAKLIKYVQRAQQSLNKVVNLDMVDSWMGESKVGESKEHASQLEDACDVARILEKRLAASWSCYSVVCLLRVVCESAKSCLKQLDLTPLRRSKESTSPLQLLINYESEALSVVHDLVTLSCRIATVRSISGGEIVEEITKVGTKWEESKLNENHNDYVDDICDRAALIWCFLSGSGRLPDSILKSSWDAIITICYRSVLEGFTRINFCSTEGRSLMSLDLASLCAGLSSSAMQERLAQDDDDERNSFNVLAKRTHPDAVTTSRHMMQYVDTYVKVFYYPLDDAMAWISENKHNYRFDHVVALILTIVNSTFQTNQETLCADLVNQIRGLYNV